MCSPIEGTIDWPQIEEAAIEEMKARPRKENTRANPPPKDADRQQSE